MKNETIESMIKRLKKSLHYNCGETCPKHCSLYARWDLQ